MEESGSCLNCGTLLKGRYCHICGERLLHKEDKKLKHFFEETFAALFFADGKFPRTIWLLISKPGELTHQYITGIRKRYLSPIQLFFFANLVYFLFPLFSTFNTNLYIQMNALPYSDLVTSVVEKELAENEIELDEFRSVFDAQSTSNAKLILIVMVGIQAVLFQLVFVRQKKFYFADFLSAAAYYTSFSIFYLLALSLLLILLGKISETWFGYIAGEGLVNILYLSGIVVYLYFFIKRAFSTTRLGALFRSFIMAACLVPALMVYRFILFWITYWMVN